ncbi:MAG: aminopeptidase, partial [Acidobacteriota bacterium]|nr:aminopeptidase [Acidobacteriota bacterium]
MEIGIDSQEPLASDALVILGFEGNAPEQIQDARIQELYASGEFRGKPGESAVLHGTAGGAKRLVLAGAGDRNKFTANEMRNTAGAIVRTLKSKGVKTITLDVTAFPGDEFSRAAAEGAVVGDFEPDRYKTDPKKHDQKVQSFTIRGGSGSAADQGRILGDAQNFSRSLANEPGNLLTPTRLAERAREMAGHYG